MTPETEQMLKILRTAVRVLGYTNQELEDKLGVYHGYLGRVLKGTIQLQYDDVVRIARALDMEPAEIFQLAYAQPVSPATEGAQRLREMLSPLQPAPAPAAPPASSAPEPRAGIGQDGPAPVRAAPRHARQRRRAGVTPLCERD
jgi:transcriptional regulator with XRE-family HTH domain